MAQRIKRNIDIETGAVTFDLLRHGETVECNLRDLFPQWDELSDVQRRVVAHAVNAKVGDSAADPEKDEREVLPAVWESLLAGEWSSRAEGSGGVSAGWTQTHESVFRVVNGGEYLQDYAGADEGETKRNIRDAIDSHRPEPTGDDKADRAANNAYLEKIRYTNFGSEESPVTPILDAYNEIAEEKRKARQAKKASELGGESPFGA